MTTDALGTANGVVSSIDHRLALTAILTSLPTGALDTRTGVFPGPGSLTILSGTSATSPMTVNVGVFQAATKRTSAQGTYLGPSQEVATTVSLAAAPGANSRIDVVYVKQLDADATVLSPDGSTTPTVAVVTGTAAASPTKPAIPTGAEEIGTVTVAAGATSTNGAGVTIANTARQTVMSGGILPIRSGDAAAGAYVGHYRDNPAGGLERWNGSAWEPYAKSSAVSGTSGTLSLTSGWAAFSPYHTPAWQRSPSGKITLSGMVARTGANFALGSGNPVQFATLDSTCVPSATVSPISYAGLGTTSASTYPVRLYSPGTNALSVVGMDSGSGTMAAGLGYINLDGIGWIV